jgi:hypothetical protein
MIRFLGVPTGMMLVPQQYSFSSLETIYNTLTVLVNISTCFFIHKRVGLLKLNEIK